MRLRDGQYWHGHWQNLDTSRDDRLKGRGWRHGRAWLSVGPLDETSHPCRPWNFGVEWVLGRWGHKLLGLRVEVADGDANDEIAGHIAIPGGALYGNAQTSLTRKISRRLCRRTYDGGREVALRIERSGVWWRLWASPHGWSRETPRWRDGHWDHRDALLGRMRYQREVLEEREILVPMPERAYPATATLTESTWTRQRFGWPCSRLARVEIEIPGGVPVPGKGENAWDCDEDAIHSITTAADSIPEGIAKLVQSALTTRERYGGQAWSPEIAR